MASSKVYAGKKGRVSNSFLSLPLSFILIGLSIVPAGHGTQAFLARSLSPDAEHPDCRRRQRPYSPRRNHFLCLLRGQESDYGALAGHPVLSAEKDGLGIVYTFAPRHGLQVGSEVEILIDWERRYRLMRLHFAAGHRLPRRSDTTTLLGSRRVCQNGLRRHPSTLDCGNRCAQAETQEHRQRQGAHRCQLEPRTNRLMSCFLIRKLK